MLAPADTSEDSPITDIAETYWEHLTLHWQSILGYGLGAFALVLLWSAVVGRRRGTAPWVGERWLRLTVALGLIGLGLWRAHANATCFDDAYISLRYAENFVAGHGLVWNEGEYVEGYTNFLWVMLVSLFMVVTPLEAPLIAVLGSMLAFALNLWVVWRISLKIAPPFHAHAFAFPIAVALLAVQNTFTDYGTTGLETAFASLMVNLGVLALVHRDSPQMTFWAGFAWIMATLTRPDHALFYAIGSAVVFATFAPRVWRARKRGLKTIWREGLLPMATYAAPFVIWLAYAAWKLDYYGELLPNTYYAKSAYSTYYSQGLVYAVQFHLTSHLWLAVVTVLALWPWFPPSNTPGRRFMGFAVPAILGYEWYVIRVGGDFMEGRFYVTVIPLLLLCAEQLVHELSLSKPARAHALAQLRDLHATTSAAPAPTPTTTAATTAPARAPLRVGAMLMILALATTAMGVRTIEGRESRWKLTNEPGYYPIVAWSPMVIDHANYRVGLILGRINAGLAERGLPPPILATGAIGLLGYYSNMPMIDRLGLTDATVAHQEIEKRGRPGHEKWASSAYIRERGVHFIRGSSYPRWFKQYGTIRWGEGLGGRQWYILIYDRELMNAIREIEPSVYFYDFEIYLDRYIARLPYSPAKKVRNEYDFFKRYYFEHNDDPERREAFAIYFQWVREKKQPRDLAKDGRWDVYKQRGAAASVRERELRQARAAAVREARGLPPTTTPTTPIQAQQRATTGRRLTSPTAPTATTGDAEIEPGLEPESASDAEDEGEAEVTEPAEDDAGDEDDAG